jgi:tetraacyldisaccharide 4'-kinase
MDFVVVNGGGYCTDSYVMQVLPEPLVQLSSGTLVTLEQLVQPVAAVAGIGNPQRFFALLQQMGLRYVPYVFADHHVFSRSELDLQEKIIVMTEKDAIKCRTFATESMYVLPIRSELSEAFWQAFWSHDKLQGLI